MKIKSLQIGDILLYKDGTGWLSRLIRWGTGSKYSHALMYIGADQVIESEFSFWDWIFKRGYMDGVQIIPTYKIIKRKGSHDVFRSMHFFKNIDNVKKKLRTNAWAIKGRGVRYDFLGLLNQALVAGRMKFLEKGTGFVFHNKNKLYCSELVRELQYRAGLPRTINPEHTTPQTESCREDVFFVNNLPHKHV